MGAIFKSREIQEWLSRNVGKEFLLCAVLYPRRVQMVFTLMQEPEITQYLWGL